MANAVNLYRFRRQIDLYRYINYALFLKGNFNDKAKLNINLNNLNYRHLCTATKLPEKNVDEKKIKDGEKKIKSEEKKSDKKRKLEEKLEEEDDSSSSSSSSDESDDEKENEKKKKKLKKSIAKPKLEVRKNEVKVDYYRGLPQITLPLPSRHEKCRFTLKPLTNTVGDFLEMLKKEDKGIDRVAIMTLDGVRIASSDTIEVLLEKDFELLVNDVIFVVEPPENVKLPKEETQKLSDIQSLIHQLYEVLNVEQHQIQKEQEIVKRLEMLRQEITPLEEKRLLLEVVANRKTNLMTWVGLGLMSVQFGILARLTWWEYSWDIMEPVTYFVTYGTAMALYAYYCLTKQEYVLPEVKDRQYLITLHKRAKKLGLDLNQYNLMQDEIADLERKLRKIRNPMKLKLPPKYLEKVTTPQQIPPVDIQSDPTLNDVVVESQKSKVQVILDKLKSTVKLSKS